MPSSAVSASPARLLRALVAGLLIAQAISGLQVWQGCRDILARTTALAAEGYLTIPNAVIQSELGRWGTAMAGGLFFTLSIGAGLTVAALLLAQLAAFLPDRRRGVFVALSTLQAVLLLRLNIDAIQPLGSLYLLLIPQGTWWLYFFPNAGSQQRTGGGRIFLLALLLPIVLLTLLWLPQNDKDLFIRIRDQLLLNNPVGQAINDYYYRNTLPPAEVFKPLHQKTLKRVSRGDLRALPATHRSPVAAALAGQDYLPVGDQAPVDLHVGLENTHITLDDGGGHTHQVALDQFLARPGEALAQFSKQIDGKAFFRRLTFYGLLLGFPISLYLFVHSLLALLARPLAGPAGAVWVAGACCLLLGVGAWWPVNAGRTGPIEEAALGAALASTAPPKRLAALRMIHDRKLEIAAYPQYRPLLERGGIAERYWLARALGVSRSKATHKDLLRLAEDPHPNVVCQAYYALGRRRDRQAIPFIIDQLKTSRHWYAQWYGYRALKALGWRQKPSL